MIVHFLTYWIILLTNHYWFIYSIIHPLFIDEFVFFSHFICLLLVGLTSSNCFISSSIFAFWLLIATQASIMGWFHSTIAMFILMLGFEFLASHSKICFHIGLSYENVPPFYNTNISTHSLAKIFHLGYNYPKCTYYNYNYPIDNYHDYNLLGLVIIIVIFPSLSPWSLNNLWNLLWLFDLN